MRTRPGTCGGGRNVTIPRRRVSIGYRYLWFLKRTQEVAGSSPTSSIRETPAKTGVSYSRVETAGAVVIVLVIVAAAGGLTSQTVAPMPPPLFR
jgi:hypothetical protein